MTTTLINTTGELVSLFESTQERLTTLPKLRREAIEAFAKKGLPGKKEEEYKYSPADKLFASDIDVALQVKATTVSKKDFAHAIIPDLNASVLVLVNGFYSKELSDIRSNSSKTIVCSLAEAFEKHSELVSAHIAKYADVNADPFIALNTAFFVNGLFVHVPDHVIEQTPIHIINLIVDQEHTFFNPRNLFLLGKNASVKMVESTISLNKQVDAVVNSLTEVVVGENAHGEYYKLQDYSDNEKHINTTQIHQSLNSHFNTNTVILNAAWVRNNLNMVLDAQNCESHLNGLFITKGNQHIDNHTLVDHRKPHCQSNQLYKGILNDRSTGVFNGKIFVRPDAQKTNAYQSSKNILLSDNATMNTKPQLEIYADDVKCSHGSSTGHIDPEALFYLQSRGLSVDSAKKLLMFAFAGDVINTIQIESVKEYMTELVSKKLE